MTRLVFATHNQGKVRELQDLCAGLPGLAVVTLASLGVPDDVVEDADTLLGNARKKAHAACAHTGLPALADDSGLEVDALHGAPGVHSARYAGEPRSDQRNLQKLLDALAGVPPERRTARFRCCLCLCRPAPGEETVTEGTLEGSLIDAPRGTSGFGYDPIFVPAPAELAAAGLDPGLAGRTLAELALEQKNRMSHRARALVRLLPALRGLAGLEKGGRVT